MNRGRKGGGGNRVDEDIPDELRCKRSDGKQWRCNARAMEGKTLCEKHYNQAKKRAAGANANTSPKKKMKTKEGVSPEVLQLGRAAPAFAETRNKFPGRSSMEGEHRMKPSKTHSSVMLPGSEHPHSSDYRHGSSYKHTSDYRPTNDYRHPSDYKKFKDSLNGRQRPSNGSAKSFEERSRVRRSPREDLYFKDETEHLPECFGDEDMDQQADVCHQCQRNDRGELIACLKCGKNQYCIHCISRWYSGIHEDDFRVACPHCRGICNCKVCIRLDDGRSIFSDVKVVSDLDKVKFLRYMLLFIQPLLQQLHQEQCQEVDLDISLRGDANSKAERSKLMKDERLYCDNCNTAIVDLYRSCLGCGYDLCLTCCRELQQGQQPGGENASSAEKLSLDRLRKADKAPLGVRLPAWCPNDDSSIPCPPSERGGCGSTSLVLKRILKSNWISKLVAEVNNLMPADHTPSAMLDAWCPCRVDPDAASTSDNSIQHLRCAAHRMDSNDNLLYCPTVEAVDQEGLGHFQKHWFRGEPVIIRDVLDETQGLRWDPLILWRAFRENTEGKTMGALDCLDWCPVEISINQFFKGYKEGRVHKTGWPELLKTRDMPTSNFFKERLPRHAAQLISSLPFHEYINTRHGVLNLASTLPEDYVKPDFGPKPEVAYGMREELERGDCVAKLHYDISDTVKVLTHTEEVKLPDWQSSRLVKFRKLYKNTLAADTSTNEAGRHPGDQIRHHLGAALDMETASMSLNGMCNLKEKSFSSTTAKEEGMRDAFGGEPKEGCKEAHNQQEALAGLAQSGEGREPEVYGGVLWDIFRRQDVLKLYRYLLRHSQEFSHADAKCLDQVTHPIFDQTFYLTMEHKKKLKDESGVEPWTFEQYVGEAVFIPAGCPYQSRNLKSCINVGLGFVSPESLSELVHLSEEFRLLPKGHVVKEDKLEAKKMLLYAANKAVKDIKHLTAADTSGGEL